MSDPATSQSAMLTSIEQADLRFMAGLMIPADRQLDVPGADDPAIMTDMIESVGREAAALKRILGLVRLNLEASSAIATDATDLAALIQHLREQDAPGLNALEAVVVRAYYRDDRVLRSIGMEPRSPFPKGFAVDESDLTLLEPVKARGRIWRDAT